MWPAPSFRLMPCRIQGAKQPLEKITVGQVCALAGTMYMISRWLRNPGKVSAFQLAHLVYDLSIQDLKQCTDA